MYKRQKHRPWPSGGRWRGLYQGGIDSLGLDPDGPYREQYPQGPSLLYRCLSRLSIVERYGKHLVVKHPKEFVNQRAKSHINGMEGILNYAKDIL
jgi:hypothetical protein